MTKSERYRYIFEWFKQSMPVVTTELHYRDVYQLIVAVILSAQCTDKRVNQITPKLFERYPDVFSLSEASQDEILDYIKSCSYPNSKAAYLKGMSEMLIEKWNGKVPDDFYALQELPGVGRKTANVIMSVAFNEARIAVDTHVFRVSKRLGLASNAKTPLQVEKQLLKHIPKPLLSDAHHWLILHGRYVCLARKPKCENCGISQWCKYYSYKIKNKL
jgi:endonuclease III